MVTELIPVVDMRFLSQSELVTLALSSSNAYDLRRCDDVVVPKIDRSVFNESAGSRKQTYSRVRLDPPKSDCSSRSSSLPRRRGRPRSTPLHATPNAASATPSACSLPASDDSPEDPDRRENLLIASFIRQLFSRDDPSSQTLTLDTPVSAVGANEKNDNWKNILAAAEDAQKALVTSEDGDRETLNSKGATVDLVALGQMVEPFAGEIRKRTEGLRTEEQLLGFLSGVEGQWGSRRKRRRFVDASIFGDVLPNGWKLLLGLKRKEGVTWLDCRRYVSPNGYQFVSCKEVSSYILSLQGVMQPASDPTDNTTPPSDKGTRDFNAGQIHQSAISNGSSSFSSPTPVSYVSGNQEKQPEGITCYDATPISYISYENEKEHLLSSHRRRNKRRKLGKTIVDGVILKDGKYVCQFCHKAFSERHRYSGHIGAHVRYQGLTIETLVDESSARKITDPASMAVLPYTLSDNNDSNLKIDDNQTTQCVTQLNVPPAMGGQTKMSTLKSSDVGQLEGIAEERISADIKYSECIDDSLPSTSDLNAVPPECFLMVTKKQSPREPADSEFNDHDMAGSNAGIIHDQKSFEEVKPNASSEVVPLFSAHPHIDIGKETHVTSFSSPIFGSLNMSPIRTSEDDVPCKLNDNEFNDHGMAVSNSSIIHDQKSFEEVKPNASSEVVPLFSAHPHIDIGKETHETSFSSPIFGSLNMSPIRTSEDDVPCKLNDKADIASSLSKPKDSVSPYLENLNNAAYNVDDVLNSLSTSKSFDGMPLDADNIACTFNDREVSSSPSKADVLEKSEYNLVNYTSQVTVCTSDYMDEDANSCFDLSLSLMDMDVKTKDKHNVINHPSGRLTSEFEKYNDKLVVEVENHSFSLSGNHSSSGGEAYAEDISTHAEGHVEKLTSREGQYSNECFHPLFDKDTVLMCSMHDTLQNSSLMASFSSEKTQDIGANMDCPFDADINESLLHEIDKPVNELEFFFGGSNSMHEDSAADEMIANEAANEAVHISLSNSSWIQATNALPILNMLPDQCGGELAEISQKNAGLQAFDDLRLGTIEPSDFALFTDPESRTAIEPSMSLGYASELDDQQCSFQLGWNISLGNIDSTSSFTSLCVWCSTEFRQEHGNDEPHSETLGFICPGCKAKFSGP
ncbi:Methyl-CpG-binding domain-containing protein 8 [Platanthera guangdongensis]|uniref:Methyl-CpG-binding domain-containing protein 8 n=1 Tax=Platanthera guangdongensis TaxID=2320717 RepID=A0ABR2N5V0_9ASPA